MKKCRLKIISSNIIDDIDNPIIQYISQNSKCVDNKNISKNINENNNSFNSFNSFINNEQKIEENKENISNEKNIQNQIQLVDLIKYDFVSNNQNLETINNKIENINANNDKGDNIESNDNKIDNINSNDNKEENNIDINDLCTISNQHIYEEDKNNISSNNYNTYTTFTNNTITNNVNNYPYNIECKKKEIKESLRKVFKKREKKLFMNRSLSYKNNNNKKDKKSIDKNNVSRNNNQNSNSKNIKKTKKNNLSLNKSGNILNININKSFCLNNNINIKKTYNNKNNNLKLKSNKKSRNINNNNHKRYNSKNSNNNSINSNKKDVNNNIMRKIKPLEIKRNNFDESPSLSFISWNIIEKSDCNMEQNINYKILIDNLLIKESQLIQDKNNITQIYENKLKPLRELNTQLMNDNNEELDREDELKGELTILKNQYEKLLNSYKKDDNTIESNNNNIQNNINNIENNIKYQEELSNEMKEIEQNIKELNDNLQKGEILLITKPILYQKLSSQEDEDITLMLKGLLISQHISNTDIFIDLIWKYDKQFQFLIFLVEELINYFKLDPNSERNILMSYFYLICKNYNYMNINDFKKVFKNKIGTLQIYNKYLYITKLLNYHNKEIVQLKQLLKDKDIYNIGIIKYETFKKLLRDIGLTFSIENLKEFLEFFIFCMKKDRRLNINLSKKNKKDKDDKDTIIDIRYSIFDLFYDSFIDFINEYNYNFVKNPLKLIKDYMEKKEINNVEYILKPLLNKKYILEINNIEYVDIIILNKYLRKIGIIEKDCKIWYNTFEEELIDIYKFINDIYDFNENENNKEEINLDKIKEISDKLIDDIFQSIK